MGPLVHARRVSACPGGGTGHRRGLGRECPGSAGTASAGGEHPAAAPRGGGGAAACGRGPAPAEQPRPLGAPASSGPGEGHHVTPAPPTGPPLFVYSFTSSALGALGARHSPGCWEEGPPPWRGHPLTSGGPCGCPTGQCEGVWLQGLEGPTVVSITSVAGGLCAHPIPGPCYSSRGAFGLPARQTEQQALPPWAPVWGLRQQDQPVKPLLSAAAPVARCPGGFSVGVG